MEIKKDVKTGRVLPNTVNIKETQKKEVKINVKSKKIVKTFFNNPYEYKINALNEKDSLEYLYKLEILFKNYENLKTTTINFKPMIKIGIKSICRAIKKSDYPIFVLYLYEENKFELFERLFWLTQKNKIKNVVLMDTYSPIIQKLITNVPKISAIGFWDSNSILEEEIMNLSIFGSKCRTELEWLINPNLYKPLKIETKEYNILEKNKKNKIDNKNKQNI